MRFATTIISIFFIVVAHAQADKYAFRHISQTDGLLNSDVKSIVQDEKGFIWLLTNDGLQRYDGLNFINYPYDFTNPSSLKNTYLVHLFEDRKQHCLWLTNPRYSSGEMQAEKYDLQQSKFTLYNAAGILKNNSFNFQIYKDSTDNTFILGDIGLAKYDAAEKEYIPLFWEPASLATNRNNSLFKDTVSGQTWVVSKQGLSLFHQRSHKIYTHWFNPVHDPLLALMDKQNLTGIMKDSHGNIWIAGYEIFYRYNIASKKLYTYPLATVTHTKPTKIKTSGVLVVNILYEDNHHTLWIGTSNAGLLRYNNETDNFINIISDQSSRLGLHYNYDVWYVFQDRDENIWVGTDDGINIFNPYQQNIQAIHHEEKNASSLPKNEIINCIQAANGDILVGTFGGGITVYDSNWNFKRNISFTAPFEYSMVWCFAQNDDGTIWAGCQHGYIHIYDTHRQTIKTIHPPEMQNSTIICMAKDTNGNIWMGLYNGKLACWNKQQKTFFTSNDNQTVPEDYGLVSNIFFDSQQRCWVSTTTGLKQFDTGKRQYIAAYRKSSTNLYSISSDLVEGVEELNDTTLMVGTVKGGLNFLNIVSKQFTHLTVNDGLPANTIHAIKKGDNGYVWFTTNYDIYKFKPAENKFIKLNELPGTVASAFRATCFYALKNKSWLTSSQTEIISFNQGNSFRAQHLPNVEITGFNIFNKSFAIDSVLNTGSPVTLSYRQNFFTIAFALMSFSNRQQTKYSYQLTGVDKQWVDGGAKSSATYTNLDPGKYVFLVKAITDQEVSPVTNFEIIIAPPFWKTWWFVLAVAALIIAMLYLFVIWRIRNLKAIAAEKMKVEQLSTQGYKDKLEALRSQMNPHFIFNCLNSIDDLIQKNEKEKATLYLSKFAGLIRSILETSKSDVIDCWKDMEIIKEYLELEALRWGSKIKYEVIIGNEIINGDYKVPPLIIQPFVENAIYHGLLNKVSPDKKLVIKATGSGNSIYYTITDNGVGRAQAQAYKAINKPIHQSLGMEITTSRIQLFNQHKNGSLKITDMENSQGEPIGTKVEIVLVN